MPTPAALIAATLYVYVLEGFNPEIVMGDVDPLVEIIPDPSVAVATAT